MKGSCAICESEIVDLVNKMISEETPYRVMQHDTGFAKSTLWAHRWRCLTRQALESYREKRKTEVGGRYVTEWETGERTLMFDPRDLDAESCVITELQPGDIVFRLRFKESPVTNPNHAGIRFFSSTDRKPQPIVEAIEATPAPTGPCRHERLGQLPGGQGVQCRDCGQQFGFHGARNGPGRPRNPI